MTIIPLPDTPDPFFRPLPQAWCYLCHRAAHPPAESPCTAYLHPRTPTQAVAIAALLACEELQLPSSLTVWSPAHIASARELVQQLQDWIGTAERIGSRAAS
jgi:hypothetical protein